MRGRSQRLRSGFDNWRVRAGARRRLGAEPEHDGWLPRRDIDGW
ncbi:hypothetical protein [Nonomuraea dietziae]